MPSWHDLAANSRRIQITLCNEPTNVKHRGHNRAPTCSNLERNVSSAGIGNDELWPCLRPISTFNVSEPKQAPGALLVWRAPFGKTSNARAAR